jgi:hypothetical protein
MVLDIKKPNLKHDEVRKLLDFGDDNILPISKTQPLFPQRVVDTVPQRVANTVPQQVAHTVPQQVAHTVPQQVAHTVPQRVAQNTWVAQTNTFSNVMDIAKAINQKIVKPYQPKAVSRRKEKSPFDQSVWEAVEKLKEHIYNLPTIEDRKKFVLTIGWGIGEEKRGKRNYLYGAKKINSIKYKLYIGNPTHL